MIAKNRCSRCGHEWQDRPLGFAIHQACPKCGSDYWEWTNYDDTSEPKPGPYSISLVNPETR